LCGSTNRREKKPQKIIIKISIEKSQQITKKKDDKNDGIIIMTAVES